MWFPDDKRRVADPDEGLDRVVLKYEAVPTRRILAPISAVRGST